MTQILQIENGDIQYQVSGDLKMVADHIKVRQDVGEMLVIDELEGFGASLSQIIGRVDQVDFIRGEIYRQIIAGVDNLIRLQRGKQRSQRPINELIDSIVSLQVVVTDGDPTSFVFQLELKTVSQELLLLSGEIFPTILDTGSGVVL